MCEFNHIALKRTTRSLTSKVFDCTFLAVLMLFILSTDN